MYTDIRLLIDEDVHLALASALRKRGRDALHVREVDRRGLDDESQLEYAARQERCFLTFNVGEFVVWHGHFVRQAREHSGIVVSAQQPLGPLLRKVLPFLQSHTAEDVRNQLFFL